MGKVLPVVFEMQTRTALVCCPCCLEAGVNGGCWCCDGWRYDRASAWEWGLTVAEQVRAWGGSDAAVERVSHLTIEAPSWLDTATGQRKPGVVVPKEDCVCHEDALPCRGCGRVIPEHAPMCIFCEEAGVELPKPFAGLFDEAPDVAPLLAQIAQLEAEREADKARLEWWIAKSTRHHIVADAMKHMLSQVLTTHAAFLAALREAEQLLQAAAKEDEVGP